MDELTRLIAEIQRLRKDIEDHSREFENRTEATRQIVEKLEDLRRRADAIEAGAKKPPTPNSSA